MRATFALVSISELNLTQGCIFWVWIWREVRDEFCPSGVVGLIPSASYTRNKNLGMLGTEQTCWHWPRVLDTAMSNPGRNSLIQILGFTPM